MRLTMLFDFFFCCLAMRVVELRCGLNVRFSVIYAWINTRFCFKFLVEIE